MGSSIFGNRVLRTEDKRFLTGEARYAEDVPVEGTLHAAFVRSPFAHARVGTIDTAEASSMPGVMGVFTAADLELPTVWKSGAISEAFARPVLPTEVVRFVGEAVACVVAETRAQAMDAAEAIIVEYDPLEPVVDPEAAASGDAPVLFPEAGTNVTMQYDMGDDPSIVEGADAAVRVRIRSQTLAASPLEMNAMTCVPDGSGGMTVWGATQSAWTWQGEIADALGIDKDSIRVIATNVGGGFGAKVEPYPEQLVVAAAAHRLGRPVRYVETRSESLLAMNHGRGRTADVEIAGNRDGTITGLRVNLICDMGAYPGLDAFLPLLTFQMACGTYAIPRVGYRLTAVVTNTTPKGAYRGAARPEAAQIIERAVDLFAAEIGMDPAEVRRPNFIPKDAFPYTTTTGASYDSGDYEAALDEALGLAGYEDLRAEQARRREANDGRPMLGVGIGSYVEITSAGPPSEFGSVEVDADGGVTVLAGTGSTGQGHETAFAQLVAGALDVPFESVIVVANDTGHVPKGEGTYGSRSLQLAGTALSRAADKVKEKAVRIVAHLLEVAPEDVEVADGRLGVVGAPDRSMSWAEVAKVAEDPERLPEGIVPGLSFGGSFRQDGGTFPFGAHVAVVEVDPETGNVDLVRHVAVDDCGPILNPMLVEGQVHGGLGQGIAQALWEEVVHDSDGNPHSGNLTTYAFPSAAEFPSFERGFTETPTHLNPLGAKGIGESATIGSTPAVVNAVVDALRPLGVKHLNPPLTPERVWRAIQEAAEGS